MNKPTCAVPECAKDACQTIYCNAHYKRLRRTGSPTGSTRKTAEQFFWAKVDKTERCWLWTAAKTHNGYGVTGITGCEQLAHRHSYTLANGPIPKGMQIDHVCYTRECVNPSHLRAVTHWENQENRAGANANNTQQPSVQGQGGWGGQPQNNGAWGNGNPNEPAF
jgi:hypothetical protein